MSKYLRQTITKARYPITITYRRKGVAGVGYEHTGLPDCPIADGDTLDESCSAHPLHPNLSIALSPLPTWW